MKPMVFLWFSYGFPCVAKNSKIFQSSKIMDAKVAFQIVAAKSCLVLVSTRPSPIFEDVSGLEPHIPMFSLCTIIPRRSLYMHTCVWKRNNTQNNIWPQFVYASILGCTIMIIAVDSSPTVRHKTRFGAVHLISPSYSSSLVMLTTNILKEKKLNKLLTANCNILFAFDWFLTSYVQWRNPKSELDKSKCQ